MTNPPSARQLRSFNTKQQLLEKASSLFYEEGIHTVGIDRILKETPTTRATFYRYFTNKEALVLAYLDHQDQIVRNYYKQALNQSPEPQERLLLFFRYLGDHICGQGFRGCAFINAAAEYPNPNEAIHQAVLAHRAWFLQAIVKLLSDMKIPNATEIARTLMVLRDGAMVGGYLSDPQTARDHLENMIVRILKT